MCLTFQIWRGKQHVFPEKLQDTYKATRWHDPEEQSLKTISAPLYKIENILTNDLLFKMFGLR